MFLIRCPRLSRFLYKTLGLFVVIGLALPGASQAEWYLAGYGGWSAPNSLGDTRMDTLGLTRGLQMFPGAGILPPNGTLTQTFRTSDLNLKNSPMFGGKAGYFFSSEGLPWLGVEVEIYTSKPTIKGQTVSTTHDLLYVPNNPQPPGICVPGQTCLAEQHLTSTLQVPEVSLRLIAFAFNVVARYPGKIVQPYVGVGGGAFYFKGSGGMESRQVVPGLNVLWGVKFLPVPEWSLFVEGKYNRVGLTNFDPVFGLTGTYSSLNVVGGVAYHF